MRADGMWMEDAALVARSSGRLQSPETYNYRTGLPERTGLYNTTVFGPVAWASGDGTAMVDDLRDGHFGHIVLFGAVPRPSGPPRGVVLVPAPRYRRFHWLSTEESRERAREHRARLVALDASGQWPYCDPLEKLLAEAGLTDSSDADERGATLTEPVINACYRSIINLSDRLFRYVELHAPAAVFIPDEARLRDRCAQLDDEIGRLDLPDEVRRLLLGRA